MLRLSLPVDTRSLRLHGAWEIPYRGVAGLLLAERDRWFLWIPIFLGAGIVLYFSLPGEPPIWLGPLWLGAALVGAWLGRGRTVAPMVLGLALIAGGFEAAQVRSMLAAAPVLESEIGPLTVSGRIAAVGAGANKQRYVLRAARNSGPRRGRDTGACPHHGAGGTPGGAAPRARGLDIGARGSPPTRAAGGARRLGFRAPSLVSGHRCGRIFPGTTAVAANP